MNKKRILGKKKHARNSRSTQTYLSTDNQGNIISFNKKPQHKNHKPSTHYMVDDNKKTAWPSITEDGKGGYKEQSYSEALKAGEVYKFFSNKKMKQFAREGSWKNK